MTSVAYSKSLVDGKIDGHFGESQFGEKKIFANVVKNCHESTKWRNYCHIWRKWKIRKSTFGEI